MTTAEYTSDDAEHSPQAPRISVRVNGEQRQMPAQTALAAFLAAQKVPARFVAVAVNNEVVPRADHAQVILQDGDVVEIVRMVGGGSGPPRDAGAALHRRSTRACKQAMASAARRSDTRQTQCQQEQT